MAEYLTAIIHIKEQGRSGRFAKYRNIKNSVNSIRRFTVFADRAFPGWHHINFYSKENKNYVMQLQNQAAFG